MTSANTDDNISKHYHVVKEIPFFTPWITNLSWESILQIYANNWISNIPYVPIWDVQWTPRKFKQIHKYTDI